LGTSLSAAARRRIISSSRNSNCAIAYNGTVALIPQRTARLFLLVVLVLNVLTLATAADKKQLPSEPINLNAATVKELQELPGVGLVTAKAIVQFRMKSGPFHRVEDLLAVRGISQAKLKKMRPYVTVSANKPPGRAAAPAKP
jgi:competence ComEA-like helix-hairpin-helix protein